MFCSSCGTEIKPGAVVCLNCGAAAPGGGAAVKSSGTNDEWLTAMLLAMFLGAFGAHNFYLKRYSIAIAQLILGICSCFIISGIWAFVDWIMILSGNYRKADGTILKQ